MDLKMKNKCALVTGSAKGIGLAIASALAGEGATVIVTGRSKASVVIAQEEIRKQYPAAALEEFSGDLTDVAEVTKLVERFPELDILVNNLGIYEPKPFEEIPDEDWLRFFEINC